MTTPLSRRRCLGGLVGALLAWVGLRPAGRTAAAPAACQHPVHQPHCADRPGTTGWWYRTRLYLVCPLCRQEVCHQGYLPGPSLAFSRLLPPPEFAGQPPSFAPCGYSCAGSAAAPEAGTVAVYSG